jgi:hypothetical protein
MHNIGENPFSVLFHNWMIENCVNIVGAPSVSGKYNGITVRVSAVRFQLLDERPFDENKLDTLASKLF